MKKNNNEHGGDTSNSSFLTTNTHACITSESESNDTESQANTGICSGTTVEGNLSRGDIDWFVFDVAQAGSIDISLNHNSRDDFDWALYKTSGGAVATGETGSAPETGRYEASSAETYFLKLTRYSGRGWYDLNVSFLILATVVITVAEAPTAAMVFAHLSLIT